MHTQSAVSSYGEQNKVDYVHVERYLFVENKVLFIKQIGAKEKAGLTPADCDVDLTKQIKMQRLR